MASYPAAFRFAPGMVKIWRQIGNSVPPLLMRCIAGYTLGGGA